jgi:hypothetical protein
MTRTYSIGIQGHSKDRHKHVGGLNWLMGSRPCPSDNRMDLLPSAWISPDSFNLNKIYFVL